jgi:hypothetical protein
VSCDQCDNEQRDICPCCKKQCCYFCRDAGADWCNDCEANHLREKERIEAQREESSKKEDTLTYRCKKCGLPHKCVGGDSSHSVFAPCEKCEPQKHKESMGRLFGECRKKAQIPVSQIIEKYLKEHGFDGLCYPDSECGCFLGNLVPCGCPTLKCQPGYRVKTKDGDECHLTKEEEKS